MKIKPLSRKLIQRCKQYTYEWICEDKGDGKWVLTTPFGVHDGGRQPYSTNAVLGVDFEFEEKDDLVLS